MPEPGDYRLVKCEVCGHPWIAHPPECSRHAYRPECKGHKRGGMLTCCDRAGEYNGFGSEGPLAFLCPEGCSCHD
jgi:hypothetical protein